MDSHSLLSFFFLSTSPFPIWVDSQTHSSSRVLFWVTMLANWNPATTVILDCAYAQAPLAIHRSVSDFRQTSTPLCLLCLSPPRSNHRLRTPCHHTCLCYAHPFLSHLARACSPSTFLADAQIYPSLFAKAASQTPCRPSLTARCYPLFQSHSLPCADRASPPPNSLKSCHSRPSPFKSRFPFLSFLFHYFPTINRAHASTSPSRLHGPLLSPLLASLVVVSHPNVPYSHSSSKISFPNSTQLFTDWMIDPINDPN